MATVTDPRDIILSPVISEKSYGLIEDNVYTFVVHPDSNKTQIKIAVEQVFGVHVTGVNTINRPGKRVRTRTGKKSSGRPWPLSGPSARAHMRKSTSSCTGLAPAARSCETQCSIFMAGGC